MCPERTIDYKRKLAVMFRRELLSVRISVLKYENKKNKHFVRVGFSLIES